MIFCSWVYLVWFINVKKGVVQFLFLVCKVGNAFFSFVVLGLIASVKLVGK